MSKQSISKQAIILSLAITNAGPTAVAVDDEHGSEKRDFRGLEGLIAEDNLNMMSADPQLLAGISPQPMFGTECFDGAVDSSGIPLLPDLSLSLFISDVPQFLVGDDVFLRTNLLNRGRDCAPESMVTIDYDPALLFVAPLQQCDSISPTSIECRFGDVIEGNTSTALLQFAAVSPSIEAQINATASTIIEEQFLFNNDSVIDVVISPGDIDFNNSTLVAVTDNALADGVDRIRLRANVVTSDGGPVNAVVNFTVNNGEALLLDDSCISVGICHVDLISLVAGDSQITASIANQILAGSPLTVTFVDPGPKQVQFTSPLIEVMEDAGILELPVIRSGVLTGPLTFTATVSDITAESSIDFIFPPDQALTWSNGDGSDQTLLLSIVNDSELEFPETFRIELIPVSGTALPGPDAVTTVRIYDDETTFFANSFED